MAHATIDDYLHNQMVICLENKHNKSNGDKYYYGTPTRQYIVNSIKKNNSPSFNR